MRIPVDLGPLRRRTRRLVAAMRAPARRQTPRGTLLRQQGAARWRRLAIDVAAVSVWCVLVTLTFVLAYGSGWVWVAALGGAAIGIATGIVGALRRLRATTMALILIAAYFGLGGALAMPSTTMAGIVPTTRTLQQLAEGAIQAWRASLMIDPPIGETSFLLVVPLISLMLAGVGAVSIALRSTQGGLAWLPPAIAGVLGIAFGTAVTYQPLLIGAGFAVVTLVWTSVRRVRKGRELVRNRVGFSWVQWIWGLPMLIVAVLASALLGPAIAPQAPRDVLRQVVEPPLDVTAYPSPLEAFRANISEHKEAAIMTVSGLPEGSRVRIATLDAYDGYSMRVGNSATPAADSGEFKRVGQEIQTQSDNPSQKVTVELNEYSGPWVPTVGETRAVTFSGDRAIALTDAFYYNRALDTALDTEGLKQSDTYTIEAVVVDQPKTAKVKAARQGRLDLPPTEPMPDIVRDLAQRWTATATTSGQAALQLEAHLQQGYYSHGVDDDEAPSAAGHSYERIQTLLSDTNKMVGDEEQYSVAMALMARHLSIPSRVVYGYKPTSYSDSVTIKGKDVSAWVELYLDGLGWVTFDPTPDKDRTPKIENDPDEVKPRPQVENPPPPPERPDRLPPDEADPRRPEGKDDSWWNVNWRLVAGIAAGVGIPLILVVLPVALIIGTKLRRRRARMNAEIIANRVAGGWSELTDKARDLGSTPSPYATRTEQAESITDVFPKVSDGADPQVLARLADTTVFGPEEVTTAQATTYWSGVDRATKGMMASVPWWRRALAWLSLRSFRRFRVR